MSSGTPWNVGTAPRGRKLNRGETDPNFVGHFGSHRFAIHSGVRIRELVPTHSPGGIVAYFDGQGNDRESYRQVAYKHFAEKWGPEYMSRDGSRTRLIEMIGAFIGPEAVEVHRAACALPADGPIPSREGREVSTP